MTIEGDAAFHLLGGGAGRGVAEADALISSGRVDSLVCCKFSVTSNRIMGSLC